MHLKIRDLGDINKILIKLIEMKTTMYENINTLDGIDTAN